jgi:predicted DsbA family dithiol-disulfide isomerase
VRAAAVGFTIATSYQSGIYETFALHRLLQWAEQEARQAAVKNALFEACFIEGKSLADLRGLVAATVKAGLDGVAAHEILTSDLFADEARRAQQLRRSRRIDAVQAVVIAMGAI